MEDFNKPVCGLINYHRYQNKPPFWLNNTIHYVRNTVSHGGNENIHQWTIK